MRSALVAQVAVDQTAYHFDKPYDYLVPADLAESARPGSRVMIPFGRGNRKRQGMILSVGTSSELSRLKPIVSVLDREPILNEEMLQLGLWMREQTLCTYFDAFHLLLPAGINLRIVASYRAARVDEDWPAEHPPDGLSPDEARMVEYLRHSRATVERERLLEVMGLSPDSAMPDELARCGFLIRTDDAVRRMNDATVKMARLAPDRPEALKLTQKQKSVVELLETAGAASVKELCYFTGVTAAVPDALVKKGVLEYFENEVYRTASGAEAGETGAVVLTEEQQAAYDRLLRLYREGKGGAALLYGVTGSGKTQVFLKLVDEVAAQGRGVIVMVPEIALTPQTLSIFRRRYGGKVAVFHSAMSLGQRMDEWKRVRSGDALVAVGTRSAVFAPFRDLGLVIIDEEQEHTYKSESSPRFHTRDVARFRCAHHRALLLLASATPSVESYTAALTGRYELCKLTKRYGEAKLPEVYTVDMREELAAGHTAAMSRFLIDRLAENLTDGKQSILLLNRRGHNTFVSCGSCGHVMTCPNCSISLTYHSANGRLMCHYCGYSEPFCSACPECGNEHVKYSGVGTQKAEQELRAFFPNARVMRMDADSTMTRTAYEDGLERFARGEYDVMIGTQMVAKGLDFPNVTLVGVLGADQSLYSDDYRSFERTFSLLTQVVGRSGRGSSPGIAVVQTVTPESPIIRLAAAQDYEKFYSQEILTRKVMIYPPYCDLCMVGFVGAEHERVKTGAFAFFEQLKRRGGQENGAVKMMILGPTSAAVPKVSNKYRYRMLIKTCSSRAFRAMLAETLRSFGRDPAFSEVSAFVDWNPDSIL